MELIPVPEFEGFGWRGGSAEKNAAQHKVSPLEAEQAFFIFPLLVGDDEKHSNQEKRYFVLGSTDAGRKLFISFTMRGKRIRVISARDMSRQERRVYRS